MDGPDSPRQNTSRVDEPSLNRSSRGCCFILPCFDRSPGPCSHSESPAVSTWWQRMRAAEISGSNSNSSSSLWARGVGALKKIREWSEIVAGPRWKTFIRRFNRNRSGNRHVNFQYDPLSYAMNFDEGPGRNGYLDENGEDSYQYGPRNFSSRYAKGSMDLGKDGPTSV